MPLGNIYGAMRIPWLAEHNRKMVLLHCMAGRNRSVMVLDCYEFMKTGKHREQSQLRLNVDDNQLPGIFRMELFLEKCREVFENEDVAKDAYIDWVKKETLGF